MNIGQKTGSHDFYQLDRRAPKETAPAQATAGLRAPRPLCLECLTRVCHHFDSRPAHLRPRYLEAIRLLGGGLSNKELGIAMELTEGTVRVYLHDIFRLLGVTSRLELALWGRDHADVIGAPAVSGESNG
jgi:DNA-binding NarL/FixJ family response regulator